MVHMTLYKSVEPIWSITRATSARRESDEARNPNQGRGSNASHQPFRNPCDPKTEFKSTIWFGGPLDKDGSILKS